MKRGRLPLTALRSFEAAGRHLSFSRAAEELFVSQAAISRQITELEALVGKPLFERLHRRVELTDAGQRAARSTHPQLRRHRPKADRNPGQPAGRTLREGQHRAFLRRRVADAAT